MKAAVWPLGAPFLMLLYIKLCGAYSARTPKTNYYIMGLKLCNYFHGDSMYWLDVVMG